MSYAANVPAPTRRGLQTLEAVKQSTGAGFDPDLWHVIETRDNALIADELLNGSGSSKFVYQFEVAGTPVAGISVVGARHLAAVYGGIKHRLVASVRKTGALHQFVSYPQPGMPMSVHTSVIHELADEDDYYSVVIEITDIKTGNVVQAEKSETRYGYTKKGDRFERPHYDVIAQSKAFRNGVLAIIHQDIQMRFKLDMMKLGKNEVITASLLDEKRGGVLKFAAAKGLTVDRHAVEALTMDQISGLADAARSGQEDFMRSGRSLGVLAKSTNETDSPPERARVAAPTPPAAKPPAQQERREPESHGRFSESLVDAVGEMVGEDLFTDPVTYARAMGQVWQSALPADKARILENNAEAIVAAVGASDQAAAIIRDLQTLTPVPGTNHAGSPASRFLPVEMPVNARGAIWPGYIRKLAAQLVTDKVKNAELEGWANVNMANILQAPLTERLKIIRAVSDYCNAIGGFVPPNISQVVEKQDDSGENRDRDAEWTDWAVKQIEDLTDKNALSGFMGSTATVTRLERFGRERPELVKRVEEAAEKRGAELDGFPKL